MESIVSLRADLDPSLCVRTLGTLFLAALHARYNVTPHVRYNVIRDAPCNVNHIPCRLE